MTAATFTRLGQRHRFFATYPSRFSKGKVHFEVWSPTHKQWIIKCDMTNHGAFSGYHGRTLDEPAEVTCKKCLRLDPR